MKSLLLRIWLTFWAVIALTFVTALVISFTLAVKRAREIDQLSPAALAHDAGEAMDRGGDDALRQWILRTHNEHPELEIFIVDPSGRELRGRSRFEVARAFANAGGGKPFPAIYRLKRLDGVYRFAFRRLQPLSFDLEDVLLQPWVLLLSVVTISGFGAAWLAYQFAGPIIQLRGGVRAISAGDLTAKMSGRLTKRPDELGALAREFDQMALRLNELMKAKEELLRDVSHELRSPLARLRVASDLGRRTPSVEQMVKQYDVIDREVGRLDDLIGRILSFSRLGEGAVLTPTELNLLDIVMEAVENARFEAAPANKHVSLSPCGAPLVLGEALLLSSAVENVLRNAVHFSPPGSEIHVELSFEEGFASLEIRDGGPGVPEFELKNIFDPFRRGEHSKGVGLGLSIVQRTLALHNGTVSAWNHSDGGLIVRLLIPLAPEATPRSGISPNGLNATA